MEVLDQTPDTEPQIRFAGFITRFLAWFADGVILSLAGWILSMVTGMHLFDVRGGMFWFGDIFTFGYFIVMEAGPGQGTFGKQFLRIKVVDENGERISYRTSLIRSLSKILSAVLLLIGYFMIIFDVKKQGLHDRIAKTYVVES